MSLGLEPMNALQQLSSATTTYRPRVRELPLPMHPGADVVKGLSGAQSRRRTLQSARLRPGVDRNESPEQFGFDTRPLAQCNVEPRGGGNARERLAFNTSGPHTQEYA
jgi:hypothetical protein